MGVIVYWSGQSELPIDSEPVASLLGGLQHRASHVAAYAILAGLLRWALDGRPHASVWAWTMVAAFAVADELHQSLTPGRRPGFDDWLTDVVTALVCLVLVARYRAQAGPRRARVRAAVAWSLVVAAFAIAVGFGLLSAVSTPRPHAARDAVGRADLGAFASPAQSMVGMRLTV